MNRILHLVPCAGPWTIKQLAESLKASPETLRGRLWRNGVKPDGWAGGRANPGTYSAHLLPAIQEVLEKDPLPLPKNTE